MKKIYLVPQVKEIRIRMEQQVMAGTGGSGGGDVDFNKDGDTTDDMNGKGDDFDDFE